MAVMCDVEWGSKQECLMAFAESFGERPPRQPIPGWWYEFVQWYDSVSRRKGSRRQVLEALAVLCGTGASVALPWWESFGIWYAENSQGHFLLRTEAYPWDEGDEEAILENPWGGDGDPWDEWGDDEGGDSDG